MNKEHITPQQASVLPAGSMIKRTLDGQYYTMANDGVFELSHFSPRSECTCRCHQPDQVVMHFMPCCVEDPETLFIVEGEQTAKGKDGKDYF